MRVLQVRLKRRVHLGGFGITMEPSGWHDAMISAGRRMGGPGESTPMLGGWYDVVISAGALIFLNHGLPAPFSSIEAIQGVAARSVRLNGPFDASEFRDRGNVMRMLQVRLKRTVQVGGNGMTMEPGLWHEVVISAGALIFPDHALPAPFSAIEASREVTEESVARSGPVDASEEMAFGRAVEGGGA